jgi:outer membrane receptor protein involved in Fe transport
VNTFRRVSPRLGLSWTGLRNQEIYASVSRGFRAPALVEIACSDPTAACPLPFALGADPPLKPVVATTYELGWHTRRPAAGLSAGADVYRTDVRDDIFFVAPTSTTGYFQNIAATRRAGFEASLRWVSSSGAQAYVNYGYTSATFETAAELSTGREPGNESVIPGDRMPMIPSHRVNAGIAVPAFQDRLRFRADARYVGQQFLRGDEENVETRLSDYGVADISAEATLGRYEVRLMVPNVLNTKYTTFGTFAENPTEPGSPVQRFLTPGQPRHLLASVSAKF